MISDSAESPMAGIPGGVGSKGPHGLGRNARRSPEEEELESKQAELGELEEELADHELEYAEKADKMAKFQILFNSKLSRLMSKREELRASIAEIIARRLSFDNNAAEEAKRARKSANCFANLLDEEPTEQIKSYESPSDSLKALFRLAAKLIHPDLADNDSERARRESMMRLVNEAYRRGDESALSGIIDDWEASPENVEGIGISAELIKIIRKIAQIKRRLTVVQELIIELENSPWLELLKRAENEMKKGRDLLDDMSIEISNEIAHLSTELARMKEGDDL